MRPILYDSQAIGRGDVTADRLLFCSVTLWTLPLLRKVSSWAHWSALRSLLHGCKSPSQTPRSWQYRGEKWSSCQWGIPGTDREGAGYWKEKRTGNREMNLWQEAEIKQVFFRGERFTPRRSVRLKLTIHTEWRVPVHSMSSRPGMSNEVPVPDELLLALANIAILLVAWT